MKVLMMSGGLDSICAFYICGKPIALYVGGGNGPARDANKGEYQALALMKQLSPEFAAQFRAILVDLRPFMREGIYKFPREVVLAIIAWAHGANTVLYGWNQNDLATDTHIFNQTQRIESAVADKDFKVEFPLWFKNKVQLVREALQLGATREIINASHSCVRQSGSHCGQCDNCIERYVALRANGIDDTDWAVIPQNSGATKLYMNSRPEWFKRQCNEVLERERYAKRV